MPKLTGCLTQERIKEEANHLYILTNRNETISIFIRGLIAIKAPSTDGAGIKIGAGISKAILVPLK